MNGSLLVACAVAGALGCAPRCGAQYATPLGMRNEARPSAAGESLRAATAMSDTVPVRGRINRTGGVIGGVLGGALGAALGAVVGYQSVGDCIGEDCGLLAGALGLLIGESVGVAAGTHIGARGHGNLLLTSLASFGLGTAGTLIGASIGEVGVVFLVVVPAGQIATVLAMER